MDTRFPAAMLAAAAVAVVGCTHELPPATTAIDALPTGGASVVFFRPVTPCDTGDYTIVADEQGRFVGNVAPGTKLSVPTTPGAHAFYSWSNLDLRVEKIPNWNPTGATQVLVGSEPAYVELQVSRPNFNCPTDALIDLNQISPGGPRWAEASKELAETRPVQADRAQGQAAFDARPVYVGVNLELGRAKLAQIVGRLEAEKRHAALQAERDQ